MIDLAGRGLDLALSIKTLSGHEHYGIVDSVANVLYNLGFNSHGGKDRTRKKQDGKLFLETNILPLVHLLEISVPYLHGTIH